MDNTLSIRLPKDVADWLAEQSRVTGLPKGQIVRQHLRQAAAAQARPWQDVIGSIKGLPPDLSTRKGFSTK